MQFLIPTHAMQDAWVNRPFVNIDFVDHSPYVVYTFQEKQNPDIDHLPGGNGSPVSGRKVLMASVDSMAVLVRIAETQESGW